MDEDKGDYYEKWAVSVSNVRVELPPPFVATARSRMRKHTKRAQQYFDDVEPCIRYSNIIAVNFDKCTLRESLWIKASAKMSFLNVQVHVFTGKSSRLLL